MSDVRKFVALILFAVSFGVITGCSSTPEKRGTSEYVDDKVLTTRVKAALLKEEGLDAANIHVDTYRDVVQLSGFVPDARMAERAVEAARRVPGVREVKNDIRLRPKA